MLQNSNLPRISSLRVERKHVFNIIHALPVLHRNVVPLRLKAGLNAFNLQPSFIAFFPRVIKVGSRFYHLILVVMILVVHKPHSEIYNVGPLLTKSLSWWTYNFNFTMVHDSYNYFFACHGVTTNHPTSLGGPLACRPVGFHSCKTVSTSLKPSDYPSMKHLCPHDETWQMQQMQQIPESLINHQ